MRLLPPADDGQRLQNLLRKHMLVIVLALAVLALAASTYYFYDLSNRRVSDLNNKSSDYDTLRVQFYNLSGEHADLIASNENLTKQYENLSERYDVLSKNASTVLADYEALSGKVARFQESGQAVALYYTVRRADTADGARVFVDATVYNVGSRTVDHITIKCKTIFEGQPNVDEHPVTGIEPLAKKSLTWNYSSYADIDALWI